MPDKNITHDDTWLIKLFKDVEIMLKTDKAKVDWSITTEFQVFSEFFIKDIQEIQERLKDADDEYLYFVCEHTFNIMDWIKLMVEGGLPTFGIAFENLFEKQFGDKYLLQNLYNTCFEKWISQKNGQCKIGENFYNILDARLYYRNRFGQWFEVDRTTAFDLKPNKTLIEDNGIIDQLNSEYKETWYDAVLKKWEERQYQGILPADFLRFENEETSPEEYSDFSIAQIRTLLKNPISVTELERWNGTKIIDLEDIVKICACVLNITKKIRTNDSHTVYLLRDCVMFYELHKTLDILEQENTSSDELLIGRKLLSHKLREGGYYVVTLEALYNAYNRYPDDFNAFYNEYARLMNMFVSLNPGFAAVIANITEYVKEHIKTDKNKIVVFDIGFQGSIALLAKYVIDYHTGQSEHHSKTETDVKIGVSALWLKQLFGDRHYGDYFPFLNRVQLAARSDELYHYKRDSLNSGKLRVTMGDKNWQRKASIELTVLVMVALLDHGDK